MGCGIRHRDRQRRWCSGCTDEEHDISLREAHQRTQQVAGVVTGQGVVAGAIDWRAAADAFLGAAAIAAAQPWPTKASG